MPRPKRKTKAEDLARVRENQRRSRERKKQHVIELQQRIQQLEAAATQAPAPSLVHENHVLRGLLESVGLDGPSLGRHLQGAGVDGLPVFQDSISVVGSAGGPSSDTPFIGLEQGLSFSPDIASYELNQLGPVSSTELSLSREMPNPVDLLDGDFSPLPQTLISAERLPSVVQSQAVTGAEFTITEDLAGAIHNLDGEIPTTTGSVNSETTLCSVAFHLIVRCNRSGKDVLELETKLRYGYRMPAIPGQGCRVDNKTLLAVLAELV